MRATHHFFSRGGRIFRPLGWMYLIPFLLFVVAKGRGYYLAPAYPMLLAAGAAVAEGWLALRRPWISVLLKTLTWAAVGLGAGLIIAIALPAAPVNSPWWDFASSANTDLKEEIGWPELTATVANIYGSLPENERQTAGIFTNNYGEAGALNMYGPALGLPEALSAVNSYWLRGYGSPPPQTLIVVGYREPDIAAHFETCSIAGKITNRYNVQNEESRVADIFFCRGLLKPWPEFWLLMRHFG